MTHIVAAHIGSQERAEAAQRALAEAGYVGTRVEVFYVTPPGEHDQFPIGGDRNADPGSRHAAKGAVKGAAAGAVAGIAVGSVAALAAPPLAPALLAAVTGTGALGGAIAGALRAAGKEPEDHGGSGATAAEQNSAASPAVRQRAQRRAEVARTVSGEGTRRGGLMIAVDMGGAPEGMDEVAGLLERCGAQSIERTEGEWRDGHWVDFDPQRSGPGPRDGSH